MSASTEKKIRAQARAEGTDKKAIAAAEEAAKAKKAKMWTIIATVAVLVFVVAVLSLNSPFMYRSTTAVTVGDREFSPAEVNYVYSTQYSNIVNSYGDYTAFIGLDTSYGIAGLKDQACMLGEEGETWRDYFLRQSKEALKQYYVLNKYFDENGLEIDEETQSAIDTEYETLSAMAGYYGYANADKMATAYYGKGVNMDVLMDMLTYTAKAEAAYNAHTDSIEVSNEEVAERYPTVEVRHILIKAVADENGEISEDALAEAKAKAEDILAQWKSGPATEESFAALAAEYSEDEGSVERGGLYDSVMQGTMVDEFDAFCFNEDHKSGDTAIVYGNNGSYEGYHVMYFVGEGNPANNTTGQSYIRNEKASAWIEDLTKTVDATESFWIRLVGKT